MNPRPDLFDPESQRRKVPKWLAVIAGVTGSLLGILTNLYSSEFRKAIEQSTNGLEANLIVVVAAAVISSVSTLLIYHLLVVRGQRLTLAAGEIDIRSDALGGPLKEEDSVVGRTIKYVEAKRGSRELVVFLHGFGLDANDFRPYMAESKFHCLALTAFGFDPTDSRNDSYKPISLESHVALLFYALSRIRDKYPKKSLSLVGFSFGADMTLFLPELLGKEFGSLRIDDVILLDPNMNEKTLTISSELASARSGETLAAMHAIIDHADSLPVFRDYCEYLYKITGKNMDQARRHAADVTGMWAGTSYGPFLDRLGRLRQFVPRAHVVLSRTYEEHFNAMARGAVARGLDVGLLEARSDDHFDLMSTRSLKEFLEGVI